MGEALNGRQGTSQACLSPDSINAVKLASDQFQKHQDFCPEHSTEINQTQPAAMH